MRDPGKLPRWLARRRYSPHLKRRLARGLRRRRAARGRSTPEAGRAPAGADPRSNVVWLPLRARVAAAG